MSCIIVAMSLFKFVDPGQYVTVASARATLQLAGIGPDGADEDGRVNVKSTNGAFSFQHLDPSRRDTQAQR